MTRYKIYTKDSNGRTVIFYRQYLKKNMAIAAYRVDEVSIEQDGKEKVLRRVI